jgi:uncharacterized membrane protein YbhN (UPF0104 family)
VFVGLLGYASYVLWREEVIHMDVLFIAAAMATVLSGLVAVVGLVWKLWRLRRKRKSRKH